MRLALLTNFIPPYRLPVFRALQQRVDTLRIFISTPMEGNRGYWQPDWSGLDVAVQRTWTFKQKWRNRRFVEPLEVHLSFDTLRQLRQYRPDAIITGAFALRTVQSLLYARRARVPVLVWATLADHIERDRGMLRLLVRKAIAAAGPSFVVNGESGARYIRSLGVAEERIHRIPQAIELAMYVSIPLERTAHAERRLLFCGAVSKLKGVDLLIDAVRLIAVQRPDRAVALTIVGDGPLRTELERVALPANVTITWVGSVSYEMLPAWYAQAGILVFPTHADEWGLVVNEAMASGMPVVGSEYSQAVDELVVDGVNGWRFRPDSPATIASVLQRALDTPDAQLAVMREHARATAMKITPDLVADRLLNALQHQMRSREQVI